MAQNKLKETPEAAETEATGGSVEEVISKPKKRKAKPNRGFVRFMSIFGIFDRNEIVKAMPFILFVSVLTMGYIANSYYAERVIRDIDRTKNELKERHAEYISTMSRLMYQSKQSEVANQLSAYGIKETTQPPQKIFVQEENKKEKEDGR